MFSVEINKINVFLKVANMICDILLIEDDNLVISGEIAIVDFENVTKSHLLQLDPLLVKKLALLNQEGSPLKQNIIRKLEFTVVTKIKKKINHRRTRVRSGKQKR